MNLTILLAFLQPLRQLPEIQAIAILNFYNEEKK